MKKRPQIQTHPKEMGSHFIRIIKHVVFWDVCFLAEPSRQDMGILWLVVNYWLFWHFFFLNHLQNQRQLFPQEQKQTETASTNKNKCNQCLCVLSQLQGEGTGSTEREQKEIRIIHKVGYSENKMKTLFEIVFIQINWSSEPTGSSNPLKSKNKLAENIPKKF